VWLPPYHDMGLIGGILGPLYSGFHVVLMSPLHFLMQPVRWLRAAHAYRGSILPGPNFAYSLCARRLTEADVEGLDLSCVETIFNGAEPIRRTAMQDFIDALAPCGLRPDVFVPCYGLAESTLIVTAADRHPPSPRYFDSAELTRGVARVVSEDHEGAALEHMSAGKPVDAEVLIVDPETRTPVSDRHVGEVWVRSQSVAQGYWRRPDETRAAFGAMTSDGRGPWLRSGDLGFMLDGELTLTSRLKDLIVLRGRNLSPPDIEATVESTHGAIRRGCAVAFSLDIEGEERLVVLSR